MQSWITSWMLPGLEKFLFHDVALDRVADSLQPSPRRLKVFTNDTSILLSLRKQPKYASSRLKAHPHSKTLSPIPLLRFPDAPPLI
jgi:hypothetical protein